MAESDLERVVGIANSLSWAPHWPITAYQIAINPHSMPRRISLVATTAPSDVPEAFIVGSLVPPQAELESIAVAIDSQRRGVGRQLFHALTEELRRQGADRLVLEVRAANTAALAFYGSLGLVQTGVRRRYYADPIDDAVLMELRIG
jgi:[ribosomal protein S18]-alanine N-acetyltransferase